MTLERGLDPADASRVYERMGRALRFGEPFEGRAKALAFAWLSPRAGQRVLEVGVGTGDFLARAEGLVGPTGTLVGLDVTAGMLRCAREAAPSARLVRGSATAPPFAPASFDLLYVGYTLDLFPLASIPPTLVALRTLLRPEGRAVFCSLTRGRTLVQKALMGTWEALHRLLGPAAVGGCRPLELSPLLRGAGFELVRREHVGQLGTPSEVLEAVPRPAASPPSSPGR